MKSSLVIGYFTTVAVIVLARSPTPTPQAESIPTEMRKFFGSLNEDEKGAMAEYAKGVRDGSTNFSLSDNQFLNDIKEQSEGLFLKLTGLRDIINSKLEGLKPESRVFIEQLIRRLIGVFGEGDFSSIIVGLKNFARDVLAMYDLLPQAIKQDILLGFPTVASIATNDIFRLIATKIADYSPDFGRSSSNGTSPAVSPAADSGRATPRPERPRSGSVTPSPPRDTPSRSGSVTPSPRRATSPPSAPEDDGAGEEAINVRLVNS